MDRPSAEATAPIPAGDFSSWLAEIQGALRGDNDSDVACGTCTACCTASQFIHISPDERDALAHIPTALLFAAPRMPPGHVLMGYDQHGRCPMLIDNRCSIYEHRPRTCRTYDCRVLPAAGLHIDADDRDKVLIAQRARRWEFSHPTEIDTRHHHAVERAARFLIEHRRDLSPGVVPQAATPIAVAAIEIHDLFIDGADSCEAGETGAAGAAGDDTVDVTAVELRLRR
ncbi:MAG: YkgJ family cysteine cluster protein [Ilumatobacteraceae bacterium]